MPTIANIKRKEARARRHSLSSSSAFSCPARGRRLTTSAMPYLSEIRFSSASLSLRYPRGPPDPVAPYDPPRPVEGTSS